MNPRGSSLVELLVVLAVVALCLSLALAFSRPSHALRAGEAVRSTLLWARANAIWRGESVSVTELPDGGGLVARLADASGAHCSAGAELARVSLGDYPGVFLEAGLPRGLVWLPSGSGRSCDGGGVVSATLRLADARRSVAVIVSSLGRVRLQEEP